MPSEDLTKTAYGGPPQRLTARAAVVDGEVQVVLRFSLSWLPRQLPESDRTRHDDEWEIGEISGPADIVPSKERLCVKIGEPDRDIGDDGARRSCAHIMVVYGEETTSADRRIWRFGKFRTWTHNDSGACTPRDTILDSQYGVYV